MGDKTTCEALSRQLAPASTWSLDCSVASSRHMEEPPAMLAMIEQPSVQSWKWIGGFPRRNVVFQEPPVSFQDWREGFLHVSSAAQLILLKRP